VFAINPAIEISQSSASLTATLGITFGYSQNVQWSSLTPHPQNYWVHTFKSSWLVLMQPSCTMICQPNA